MQLTDNSHQQDVLSGNCDLFFAEDTLEELMHVLSVWLHAPHVSRVPRALQTTNKQQTINEKQSGRR